MVQAGSKFTGELHTSMDDALLVKIPHPISNLLNDGSGDKDREDLGHISSISETRLGPNNSVTMQR